MASACGEGILDLTKSIYQAKHCSGIFDMGIVSELSEKSFESTKIHHILLACMQCFNSKRLSSARYTYSAKNRQCIHTAVELIREVTEVHVLHMKLLLNCYTEDAMEFHTKLYAAWKHSLLTLSDILSKLVRSFSSMHCI